MKVLFLLMSCPNMEHPVGMYADLAYEFLMNGHDVTILTSKLHGQTSGSFIEGGCRVVRTGVIEQEGQKNIIKKGTALVTMGWLFKITYKKYIKNESFDWIFLPTPPITFINLAEYIKRKAGAKLYLILRDIFPECAYYPGSYKDNLFYNTIFKYLYIKAQKSYRVSDLIGCMSPGNVEFVKGIAQNMDKNKLVVLPNWLKEEGAPSHDAEIKKKIGLEGKFILIYGGSLGLANDIDRLVRLAIKVRHKTDVVFLIIGKGVLKDNLMQLIKQNQLNNIIVKDYMARDDYNCIQNAADVGLIFLGANYPTPTCPSKAIAYMSCGTPIFALINKNNDYGQYYIEMAQCGFWNDGDDDLMYKQFNELYNNNKLREEMGKNGYNYYIRHYTSSYIYRLIMNQI